MNSEYRLRQLHSTLDAALRKKAERDNMQTAFNQEMEKKKIASLDRLNAAQTDAINTEAFIKKRDADRQMFSDNQKHHDAYALERGQISPALFASKYGSTGLEGVGQMNLEANDKRAAMFNLLYTQQGRNADGTLPRQSGRGNGGTDADILDGIQSGGGQAGSPLIDAIVKSVSDNPQGQPMDIDSIIAMADKMQGAAYGNRGQANPQTNFTVGRGGQQWNVDTSGTRAKWAVANSVPKNAGGDVTENRNFATNPAPQQALSTPTATVTPRAQKAQPQSKATIESCLMGL